MSTTYRLPLRVQIASLPETYDRNRYGHWIGLRPMAELAAVTLSVAAIFKSNQPNQPLTKEDAMF